MLMPWGNQPNESVEYFARKLNRRAWLMAAMAMVGACTGAAGLYLSLGMEGHESSFMAGFVTGVGFGMLAGALVQLIRTLRIVRNPEKLQDTRIRENDERKIAIFQRAAQHALVLAMMLFPAGGATLALLGHFQALLTLLACGALLFALFYGFYLYFSANM